MLERPEHVFALSRMLLFGFTEATGSVRERCDTFGDLQPPTCAWDPPTNWTWCSFCCFHCNTVVQGSMSTVVWKHVFERGFSKSQLERKQALKLCTDAAFIRSWEKIDSKNYILLKTSRSFWENLLLMAEVLLWRMKEEQRTCVLVFTLDWRHCYHHHHHHRQRHHHSTAPSMCLVLVFRLDWRHGTMCSLSGYLLLSPFIFFNTTAPPSRFCWLQKSTCARLLNTQEQG